MDSSRPCVAHCWPHHEHAQNQTLPMMGATFTENFGADSNRDDDAASAWTGDTTTTTTTTPSSSCELDTDRHATGDEGRGVGRRYRNLGLWLAVVSTVANIVVVCVVYAYSL